VARIQDQLGSDIAMCLDAVPPADAPRDALEDAVRPDDALGRTTALGRPGAGPARLRNRQGGTDAELRSRSIEEITALGFDGYALGGLAIGEDRELMFETVGLGRAAAAGPTAPLLHGNRRPSGRARGDRARD
jgi:queuine tRNA-ribosyltransferase